MKLLPRFLWIEGRQGTGYRKMIIGMIHTPNWGGDLHLIHYPPGSGVPEHTDRVSKGFRHFRVNVVLWKPRKGGEFTGKTLFRLFNRVFVFRPDIEPHAVSPCEASRYVLSLGLVVPEEEKSDVVVP
jgi:hypothetical protein